MVTVSSNPLQTSLQVRVALPSGRQQLALPPTLQASTQPMLKEMCIKARQGLTQAGSSRQTLLHSQQSSSQDPVMKQPVACLRFQPHSSSSGHRVR